MIIKIVKIKRLNSKKPLSGLVTYGEFHKEPKIGERFFVGECASTSRVTKILSQNTFETLNSVYKWKKI